MGEVGMNTTTTVKENIGMNLVVVRFRDAKSPKTYSYLSKVVVKVDDIVVVKVGGHEKHAIVVETFPIKEIVRVGE